MARDNALFQSLLKEFRGRIRDSYVAGEELPSQRQMSQMYGVSQTTILRVYKALETEGLLTILPRKRCVRASNFQKRKRNARLPRIGLITPLDRSHWEKVCFCHYQP